MRSRTDESSSCHGQPLPMHRYMPCLGESLTYDECDHPDRCRVVEVFRRHPYYPSQFDVLLGADAPPVLYSFGNLALFEETRTVMICGARKASQEALGLAHACAGVCADEGVMVSSGFARGIDMAAHTGALAAGGDTTAYLPYGLARLRMPSPLVGVYAPERFLAITECRPEYGFTVKNALRRNTLMTATADAIIVIEPGETGGTWYSARKAADMGKPLFYLEGERPECIERLEDYSARRIAAANGVPDLDEVFAVIGR